MQTNSPAADEVPLKPGEAAALLGVTPKTMARLVARGDVRAVTLPSGHRRYSRADVEKLAGRS